MICEHCGSRMVEGGQVCAVCGMSSAAAPPRPRDAGKVIALGAKRREKARALRPPRSVRRRRSPVLWWIVAIVAIALLLPYLLPLR